MLPIPLPMSTIADDLSAALQRDVRGGDGADLDEPDRDGLGANLGAGGDEPLGALAP
jgi:hypothetical protein